MKDHLTQIVHKQRYPRKEIKYWIAVSDLTLLQIDQDNSIALLRSRTKNCTYHAIR